MPAVFITGSTRGIGRDVASRLAASGWTVGINGRDPELVNAVVADIGAQAIPFAFDIRDTDELGRALMQFNKATDGMDAFVHSAGLMKDAPLGLLGDDLIDEVVGVNTTATLKAVQLASRVMSRNKRGSIVLINSVVGLDGAAGQSLYSMSKSALTGLVKSAAKELGPRGIRVNGIAPGLIQTELIEGLSDEVIETQKARIPLGRLGDVADVSAVVEFLVSDGAGYVTGQTLRIDGGYTV